MILVVKIRGRNDEIELLGAHYAEDVLFSGDLNTLIHNTCRVVDNRSGNVSNVPSDFTLMGILSVSATNESYGVEQKLYVTQEQNVTGIYYRYKWGNSWSAWYRNDNYATSTLSELASALGVPKLPQNTTTSIMISDVTSTQTQKINMGLNRGSGIVLWHDNLNSEGVFVFTFDFQYGATAKFLIKRAVSIYVPPKFYYDGNRTVAIKISEAWGSWTIISSNNNLPPKGTADSDLTGFTEITIQE